MRTQADRSPVRLIYKSLWMSVLGLEIYLSNSQADFCCLPPRAARTTLWIRLITNPGMLCLALVPLCSVIRTPANVWIYLPSEKEVGQSIARGARRSHRLTAYMLLPCKGSEKGSHVLGAQTWIMRFLYTGTWGACKIRKTKLKEKTTDRKLQKYQKMQKPTWKELELSCLVVSAQGQVVSYLLFSLGHSFTTQLEEYKCLWQIWIRGWRNSMCFHSTTSGNYFRNHIDDPQGNEPSLQLH